jgi:hypothetical protein
MKRVLLITIDKPIFIFLFILLFSIKGLSQTCSAFTVPFHEGFNSDSTTESCWTIVNGNGDNYLWDTNYTTNPYEGNQCASYWINNSLSNDDDWLISPQIILTGNDRLKFKYRVGLASNPANFRLLISVTGNNPSDFISTLVPLASYSNTTYKEIFVNLSGYIGPVNIAWHIPGNNLGFPRLYIDDIDIETMPACVEPADISFLEKTHNSITLTWPDTGAASYQIITLPCGSPEPLVSETNYTTSSSNTTTITSLAPNSCYDFYVRANCGSDGLSIWSFVSTATTQNTPPPCGGQFVDLSNDFNGNYLNN